jgi:predicted nicotinamide N-methyase
LNHVSLEVDGRDLLRLDPNPTWDLVLVGDALYTTDLADDVETWIGKLIDKGIDVLIGEVFRKAGRAR